MTGDDQLIREVELLCERVVWCQASRCNGDIDADLDRLADQGVVVLCLLDEREDKIARYVKRQAGDRVWYEPTPGARFAAIVDGPGTLPDTYLLRIGQAFWAMRGEVHRSREYMVAAAAHRMTSREEIFPGLILGRSTDDASEEADE